MSDPLTSAELQTMREKLRARGIAIASGNYFATPNAHGFPVEICPACYCIVDAEFFSKHQEQHAARKFLQGERIMQEEKDPKEIR